MEGKETYYMMGKGEVLKSLNTSEKGLSSVEVEKRQLQYGPNELKAKKKESVLQMFISQFKDYLILILIAATAVSAFLGETTDAIVILAIVIANAIIGFVQEYNAEKAMDALKRLAAPHARVMRDSVPQDITARELVPGDIVMLEEGESIPADCRMLESMNFRVNEASLTGESVPLSKKIEALPGKNLPLGDQRNMTFTGTIATYGRGTAVVTATGMGTEMGKIAEMLQIEKEKLTPLQLKLDHFGKRLGMLILVICGLVFLIGTIRGGEPLEMFITAVSLAVAAIPEGLPAVVTVTLAIGLKRMAKRNALVRKLPAVETLGSATVICSDKTGTLTRNEMTVRRIYMAGKAVEVRGEGYKPKGEFAVNDKPVKPDAELTDMLRIGMLCNNANLVEKGGWHIIGDPTEGALVVLGEKAGLDRKKLKEEYKRVSEIPFGSERKRMSTINRTPEGKLILNVKGAPEMVLKVCDRFSKNGKVVELTEKDRNEILKVNEEMANDALRVLAYAYREAKVEKTYTADKTEKGLIFVGLVGMIDPPRKEAKQAIKTCEKAHIKVVMITGDHALTAKAIGKELGLLKEGSKTLTGAELQKLSDHEFDKIVDGISVYARVNPEHKVRIVDALKKKGHVVAMTGDGVNDAPALRKADIGIAMGITGTDVSKEAADMILADDNFVSIVSAVEEGRGIYNNIRKFIRYLLSCNSGEIFVIFASMLINLPLPLLPIQILWMNLVTDGLPALALGMDPAAPNIMERKPRRRDEPAVTKEMSAFIVIIGLIMCIGTLGIFAYELGTQPDHYRARTVSFTTLVMFQMFVVLSCRSRSFPLHKLGFFTNKHLLAAIATSILLQGVVIYVPFFQNLFKTVALTLTDWLVIAAVSSSIFFIIEIKKVIVKAYVVK